MPDRPRWILESHPTFTDPLRLRPLLVDPIVLDAGQPLGLERLPALSGPVVVYGTQRRLRGLLRLPGVSDGIFDHYGELRCSSYYRHLHGRLGRAAVLAPLGALAHLPLRRMFGPAVFVRPDDNAKSFSAELLPLEGEDDGAAAVADFLRRHGERRDALVVLSEVVALGREYRCFVRRGRVFAHSSYPEPPHTPAPPAVCAFAEAAAAELMAASSMTMLTVDVAQGEDGALRLVEVGGVCSWGLYGADPAAFVAAMEAEATERHADLWGP